MLHCSSSQVKNFFIMQIHAKAADRFFPSRLNYINYFKQLLINIAMLKNNKQRIIQVGRDFFRSSSPTAQLGPAIAGSPGACPVMF